MLRAGELAALLLCGCSLASGVELTRPSSGVATPRFGPVIDAELCLPRTYRLVAGAEWTRPGLSTDRWRTGGYLGYREASGRIGWESTARAGLLQDARGDAGAFGGVRVALLMRLSGIAEPLDDPLLEALPFLVADVGVNGLAPAGQSLQPELTARLLLRLTFGSALVP